MKFFIASSLLLTLAAFAQNGAVGTPAVTGAGSGAAAGISQTAAGLGSSTVAPNPLPANPSVNPMPEINDNPSVINNPTIAPYPGLPSVPRQSQEETNPSVLPGQPSAFPPVNNPGQPANVDANGRPIVP